MAANSNLSLTSLDFDTLKANFITYLQSQTQFKDYNFSGSNINVLLDILSYNSFLNTFYLNMVASEMFLDSAQLLNSVASHSKELNYVPRSAASSSANISFQIATTGISNPLVLPAGTTFVGVNSNGTFNFQTSATTYYTSSNVSSNNVTTYNINNLLIYEGDTVTDSFIMDYTQQGQQFVLSNPNIDISSLIVTVYQTTSNSSNTGVVYSQVNNLFNLNGNSTVYFVQAAQDGQYEILFGDGLLGYVPLNSSLITANYRIASGNTADGISTFTLSFALGSYNGGSASMIGNINCTSNSTGGASQEDINSIKFNAPRYFATQERGVSSDDYSALVLANYGSDISDVTVYGGELLTPKQYGYVAICLKPSGSAIAPDYIKNQITTFLLNYSAIPTRIIITDPDYFYIGVTSNVSYSSTNTTLSASDIQNEVLNTMEVYANTYLQSFNGNFRYSKFIAAIDDSDTSIISNDTSVTMIKRITPILNTSLSYTINYNNQTSTENYPYKLNNLVVASDAPTFYSSQFTYIDTNGIAYPNSILRDDNYGNLIIFTSTSSGVISELIGNIGTINYETGQVQINYLSVSEYAGNYISLYMILNYDDIVIQQNQILLIDPNDVSITITPE